MEGNECHTEDRNDLRSLTEPCAGNSKEDSQEAIENLFRLNHWPYINAEEKTVECIKKTFSDSYRNLSKT